MQEPSNAEFVTTNITNFMKICWKPVQHLTSVETLSSHKQTTYNANALHNLYKSLALALTSAK